MNVIWHYDVPPEANSAHFPVVSKTNQYVMHGRLCEKLLAIMHIESNKIQRGIVSLKYPVETSRPVRHECQRTS